LAAFSFTENGPKYDADEANLIYGFDAATLETVGTSFEGHTVFVTGLALSFNGALLARSSDDQTTKLPLT
jgi:hypothetical protein